MPEADVEESAGSPGGSAEAGQLQLSQGEDREQEKAAKECCYAGEPNTTGPP